MNNTSVLGAVRSRWWLILLFTAIGAGLAAIPAPTRVGQESQATRYTATNTMLLNNPQLAQSAQTAVSPNQVALFATTGDVPRRVLERVDYPGNAAQLASTVQVNFDINTGALTFTTTQDSAALAEQIANGFAEETDAFITQRQDEVYTERRASSLQRLDDLQRQLDDVTAQLGERPEDPALLAQRDAISRQYSVAFEQNAQLDAEPVLLVFTTLAAAEAVPIETRGLGAPQSRTTRGALGAIVGAAVGVGLAILFGRLDRRVRTREQAEDVTQLRARVVVPKAKDDKQAQSIVASGRHDSLSDAYRTLRNVVGFVHTTMPPVQRARITLVVSAGPGEGKTTLASNLAAAHAEAGMRTVAVNTDFRRPQLSARLASDRGPSSAYFLDDLAWVEPEALLTPTPVKSLSVFDLASMGPPGELARVTASMLPRLAEQSDAIVIDSSPVAATAEVLELVPMADVIVMVVRLGRTDTAAARRTIAMLRDLTTNPIMLVIVGEKRDAVEYYYDYSERRQPNSAATSKKPKARRRGDRGQPAITSPRPRDPYERTPGMNGGSTLNLDEIDEFLRQQPPPPPR